MSYPEKQLTFGEKACGVSFNPGGDESVAMIKAKFADIVDEMQALRESTENEEMKRMYSIAITEAQTAQMWAVKAVTWKF